MNKHSLLDRLCVCTFVAEKKIVTQIHIHSGVKYYNFNVYVLHAPALPFICLYTTVCQNQTCVGISTLKMLSLVINDGLLTGTTERFWR